MNNSNETNPDPESAVPTPATTQIKPISDSISTEQMTTDSEKVLKEFSADYEKMAK